MTSSAKVFFDSNLDQITKLFKSNISECLLSAMIVMNTWAPIDASAYLGVHFNKDGIDTIGITGIEYLKRTKTSAFVIATKIDDKWALNPKSSWHCSIYKKENVIESWDF